MRSSVSFNFDSEETAMLPRTDIWDTFLTETRSKVTVDLAHQATRWPVYKDVSQLWRYDYAAAERKRFKGREVWDPSRVPAEQVSQYLQALSFNWGPKSGLTEDMALTYLASHNYSIESALRETLSEPLKLKALIRAETKVSEKIETIAFIGSLLDD